MLPSLLLCMMPAWRLPVADLFWRLCDPQTLAHFTVSFVMSFRERLARNFADAQQTHDEQRQQVMNAWVTKIKEHFMKHCEAASRHQRPSVKMDVARPVHLTQLGVGEDALLQKLQDMLQELGFRQGSNGSVTPFQKIVWKRQGDGRKEICCAQVTAKWMDDAPVSFAQRLAGNVNKYGAQTQEMILQEISAMSKRLMLKCEAQSKHGKTSCGVLMEISKALVFRRDFRCLIVKKKIEEHLAELGFGKAEVTFHQNGQHRVRSWFRPSYRFAVWVSWDPDALAHDDQEQVASNGGTCASCPICYQHRPAVALVPCGHVVCRDCHRGQRLLQCPMCREVTTSATRGLFMDQ